MLKAGNFDIIFISKSINDETVSSKYAFTENLHISIPKSNPLSEKQSGVYFSDIDGQPFLVANNLAIWDEIKAKNLPNSKFIKQSMNDLYNVVSASTIPSFSTNVTIPIRSDFDRVNIPILDEEASVTFYAVFLKQNKNKIRNFLNLIK